MKNLRYILIFVLLALTAQAQQEQQEDLKVGLVLSGGGAKGLAHIGAIKVIEQAGVRIDYIGGTSMGAIVGGLYAAGYSARQLDSIFEQLDFDRLIQDDIPRRAKTFYEKNESDTYAVTLPFDGFKVDFPSGLSKGQNVYNLFSRLTAHVNNVDDFTQLPIPFFCIATNIETGEEVILDKGYLPQAISASGALPSIFSPVIINDTVLVDGGVTNNYPVEEMRRRGVDLIIGVDVQDSLRTREKLNSAFDVLIQINNYRTIKAMREKRDKTDVYINPDITGFNVISFDQGRNIINAGEAEAGQKFERLKAIAARQERDGRPAINFGNVNKIYLQSVGVQGNENYTRAYVLGKLQLRTPDSVSFRRLNDGINNLSATGNFQDINYRFVPEEQGGYSVQFDLRESNSRTLLRLGAHYDDLFKTAALINITRKRLFTNNDIASLDFVVGDFLRYNFNYYIDKGYYWSIGFQSEYNYFEQEVPLSFISPDLPIRPLGGGGINELFLKYGDLSNRLYLETIFRRTFLIGAGLEHKWLRYFSETVGIDDSGNPRTVFDNTQYFNTYGYLSYDSLDNSFFPNSGFYLHGDIHLYLFASGLNDRFSNFSISSLKARYAYSLTPTISLVAAAEGGVKIGNDDTRSFDFFLGGYGFRPLNNIIPFIGLEPLSRRGDTYLKAALTFDLELFKKNHLTLMANVANIGDEIFESSRWFDRIDYTGFGLGYGLETFLGPLQVIYAYSPDTQAGELHVNAGFRF
jgi:NTE family protein